MLRVRQTSVTGIANATARRGVIPCSKASNARQASSSSIETNVVSGTVELATLADGMVAYDGGGLGRKLTVYRLPEADWSRHLLLEHNVTFPGGADLPVYVRVTQADGHQAWSSPIYLIE